MFKWQFVESFIYIKLLSTGNKHNFSKQHRQETQNFLISISRMEVIGV